MARNSRLNSIIKARKKIAETCLNTTEQDLGRLYEGEFGVTYKTLLAQLAIENPCLQREKKSAEKSLFRLRKKTTIPYFMAAMIYHRAYDLRFLPDIRKIPNWLLQDFVRYMGCPVYMFFTTSETQRLLMHIKKWVDYIHHLITSNPKDEFSYQLANYFLSETDFGPLYFNNSNLRNLYLKRGEIIEYVLKNNGNVIEHNFENRNTAHYPIRIGIVANHFAPHPETFATLPVYEHLGQDFYTILYTFTQTKSETEQYCSSQANALKLLPELLIDQVKLIREDDLDILFIATNITSLVSPICLLAAHQLARRQIAGVGSVTTTGLRNIDYYLTGKLSDEEENEDHYSEKLAWLPGAAHCFSYGSLLRPTQTQVTRQQLSIGSKTTVFASCANMLKISPELINAWVKILKSVPDAILMLLPYGPNWASNYPKEAFEERLHKTFQANKLSVNRLLILDPQPTPTREDIREYLRITDVYLDSFPFSGTTSFIEPLENSLPIVTIRGTTFRNRMGAALLIALDMNSLVAESTKDYIRIAVDLGKDSKMRTEIRRKIKNAVSKPPEFLDSKKYSQNVAKILKEIVNSA